MPEPASACAGRDRLRDGRVRGLAVRVAVERVGVEPVARQQLVEQHARAGAERAVDEARAPPRHVGEAAQAQRIARAPRSGPGVRRAKPIILCSPGLSSGL